MAEDRCWLCPISPKTSVPEVAPKGLFSVNYCIYSAFEGLYTEPTSQRGSCFQSLLDGHEFRAGTALPGTLSAKGLQDQRGSNPHLLAFPTH